MGTSAPTDMAPVVGADVLTGPPHRKYTKGFFVPWGPAVGDGGAWRKVRAEVGRPPSKTRPRGGGLWRAPARDARVPENTKLQASLKFLIR